MKALIVIPTTAGLVTIRRVSRRLGVPTSFIVSDGDYRPLYASEDYGRLTSNGGPLAAALGRERAGSFELRVDRPFETGRSWEVPVCMAHAMIAEDFSLVDRIEEADVAVWTTGAVDADLSIVSQHYSVGAKLEKSSAWFRAAAEASRRIIVAIPASEDATALAEQASLLVGGPAVRIIVARRVGDILGACVGTARNFAPVSPGPVAKIQRTIPDPASVAMRTRGKRGIKTRAVVAGIVIVLGTSVWAAYDRFARNPLASRKQQVDAEKEKQIAAPATHAVKSDEAEISTERQGRQADEIVEKPVTAAPKPKIMLTELRAPAGSDCSSLLFGESTGERLSVAPSGERRFQPSDLDGLCAVEYDVTGSGPSAELSLDTAILDAGPRRVGAPGSAANRFRKLTIFLRQRQLPPMSYRISFYPKENSANTAATEVYTHELHRVH